MDPKKKLAWIDTRLKGIEKRLEKERKNLVDSGFLEGSSEFWELFYEIYQSYQSEKLPLILARHKIEPYTGEEKERMERNYEIFLDNLPTDDDLKEFLAFHKERAARRKKAR